MTYLGDRRTSMSDAVSESLPSISYCLGPRPFQTTSLPNNNNNLLRRAVIRFILDVAIAARRFTLLLKVIFARFGLKLVRFFIIHSVCRAPLKIISNYVGLSLFADELRYIIELDIIRDSNIKVKN